MSSDLSPEFPAHPVHDMQLRMQVLLDASHEAGVGMDDAGLVTDWNRPAELLFGWQRQEVLGKAMAPLLIPARFHTAHNSGGSCKTRHPQ